MIAQLLQGRDARQVCVCLRGALKARSEHPVAEELPVELPLQGRQLAEECPVQAWRQVAVDDLLRASQDEHASEPGQLCRSLLAQNSLLLTRCGAITGWFSQSPTEKKSQSGETM